MKHESIKKGLCFYFPQTLQYYFTCMHKGRNILHLVTLAGYKYMSYMSPIMRASSALTTMLRMRLEWSAISAVSFCLTEWYSLTWDTGQSTIFPNCSKLGCFSILAKSKNLNMFFLNIMYDNHRWLRTLNLRYLQIQFQPSKAFSYSIKNNLY